MCRRPRARIRGRALKTESADGASGAAGSGWSSSWVDEPTALEAPRTVGVEARFWPRSADLPTLGRAPRRAFCRGALAWRECRVRFCSRSCSPRSALPSPLPPRPSRPTRTTRPTRWERPSRKASCPRASPGPRRSTSSATCPRSRASSPRSTSWAASAGERSPRRGSAWALPCSSTRSASSMGPMSGRSSATSASPTRRWTPRRPAFGRAAPRSCGSMRRRPATGQRASPRRCRRSTRSPPSSTLCSASSGTSTASRTREPASASAAWTPTPTSPSFPPPCPSSPTPPPSRRPTSASPATSTPPWACWRSCTRGAGASGPASTAARWRSPPRAGVGEVRFAEVTLDGPEASTYAIAEAGRRWTLPVGGASGGGGWSGEARLGGWLADGNFRRLDGTAGRTIAGAYANAEQTLHANGPGGRGASVFVQLGLTDDRYSPIRDQLAAGLVWTGLFPGRPADVSGLYASRAGLSGAPGSTSPQDAEWVLELTHAFQITPSFKLQPDLQYVVHAGGDDRNLTLAGPPRSHRVLTRSPRSPKVAPPADRGGILQKSSTVRGRLLASAGAAAVPPPASVSGGPDAARGGSTHRRRRRSRRDHRRAPRRAPRPDPRRVRPAPRRRRLAAGPPAAFAAGPGAPQPARQRPRRRGLRRRHPHPRRLPQPRVPRRGRAAARRLALPRRPRRARRARGADRAAEPRRRRRGAGHRPGRPLGRRHRLRPPLLRRRDRRGDGLPRHAPGGRHDPRLRARRARRAVVRAALPRRADARPLRPHGRQHGLRLRPRRRGAGQRLRRRHPHQLRHPQLSGPRRGPARLRLPRRLEPGRRRLPRHAGPADRERRGEGPLRGHPARRPGGEHLRDR